MKKSSAIILIVLILPVLFPNSVSKQDTNDDNSRYFRVIIGQISNLSIENSSIGTIYFFTVKRGFTIRISWEKNKITSFRFSHMRLIESHWFAKVDSLHGIINDKLIFAFYTNAFY